MVLLTDWNESLAIGVDAAYDCDRVGEGDRRYYGIPMSGYDVGYAGQVPFGVDFEKSYLSCLTA